MNALDALAVYSCLAFVTLMIGLLLVLTDTWGDARETGARMVFLCWAWPALLLIVTVRGVKHLWELADWGSR